MKDEGRHSVYDGRRLLGMVDEIGPHQYAATGADDIRIGVFESLDLARSAIITAAKERPA